MTPPFDAGWDDARLDAAFAARATTTPVAPSELVPAVSARIGSVHRGAPGWQWLAAGAAMVSVAVLVGGSMLLLSPTPTGSPSVASRGPSASPPYSTPNTAVLDALGDPITVSDALKIRDGSADADREVAVRGFLSPGGVTSCPALEIEEPAFLACAYGAPWFMERPEARVLPEPGSLGFAPPDGPAFQVAFVVTDIPAAAQFGASGDAPVAALLVGHFADRRAALCQQARRPTCALMFIVDRIAELGGEALGVQTFRYPFETGPAVEPTDRQEDLDALVAAAAPGAVVQSRSLFPISALLGVEPILIADEVVPHFGNQESLIWLETVTDLRSGVPIARTFALIDGTNWFAEITAAGAQLLDRTVVEPTGLATPALPAADPSAFDAAPRTIFGMPVLNVAQVVSQRKRDQAGDRDEYAIAGWYVPPRPGATCDPPLPAIHAPTPPCDAARDWLLFDPQQYGVRPGQLRADPEEYPDVLNPLIPVDVPFDVRGGWVGDTPRPLAVIVLGHFNDVRVEAFHGNAYFVVDALAWTADASPGPADRVVRLTGAATEDPATVLARISAASTRQALVTWATAAEGRDLLVLDPWTPSFAQELSTGGAVWIVRRLVLDTADGRPRVAVETGYTADDGTRVWLTPTPDSEADLATTIDLQNVDANTDALRVFDYGDVVSRIVAIDPSAHFTWHDLQPIPDFIQVARGATNREVAVRWRGVACDRVWRLDVNAVIGGPIVLQPLRSDGECEGPEVLHRVLLVFDAPVDLERFQTGEPCCG